LMPIVPGLVFVILASIAVAALRERWRSAPEIERLSLAARRAMVAMLATAGFFHLALHSLYGFLVSPATPLHLDAVISLGFAGIAGIVTFGRARDNG
ncbi:MAG: hypothetical protein H5U40_17750, partial [Polyangiaceae bacterium]|nr:hypothetical protein [Polyangiaceae bacterium]